MTYTLSFKADYIEAARQFRHFISHDEMERYHAVNWATKLDKALGMPWTLYRITPSVSLRFSFSGAAYLQDPATRAHQSHPLNVDPNTVTMSHLRTAERARALARALPLEASRSLSPRQIARRGRF